MRRLVLRRLIAALPNLAGVVIVTCVPTRALPGDPAARFADAATTQEGVAQVRTQLGLHRPLPEQFSGDLAALARGDPGLSIRTSQPVLQELLRRLPASPAPVLLALVPAVVPALVPALVPACAVALPLGAPAALAATRHHRPVPDRRRAGWRCRAVVGQLQAAGAAVRDHAGHGVRRHAGQQCGRGPGIRLARALAVQPGQLILGEPNAPLDASLDASLDALVDASVAGALASPIDPPPQACRFAA